MTIKQRSIGLEEERHFPYFDENKILPDSYIRDLIDEDIRRKNQFKFLPSTSSKESDFIEKNQVYPFSKTIPTFASEGYFKGNIFQPDFQKLVAGLPDDFQKGFIEYAQKCWDNHLPFAFTDCINDFKGGVF
jgi:hypothetical protein